MSSCRQVFIHKGLALGDPIQAMGRSEAHPKEKRPILHQDPPDRGMPNAPAARPDRLTCPAPFGVHVEQWTHSTLLLVASCSLVSCH